MCSVTGRHSLTYIGPRHYNSYVFAKRPLKPSCKTIPVFNTGIDIQLLRMRNLVGEWNWKSSQCNGTNEISPLPMSLLLFSAASILTDGQIAVWADGALKSDDNASLRRIIRHQWAGRGIKQLFGSHPYHNNHTWKSPHSPLYLSNEWLGYVWLFLYQSIWSWSGREKNGLNGKQRTADRGRWIKNVTPCKYDDKSCASLLRQTPHTGGYGN